MTENSSSNDLKSAASELLAAITKVLTASASAIESFVGESVKGSGVIVDRTYDLSGFTSVAIGSAFKGEITRGDGWGVVVTSDENVIDKIKVVVEEETLHVKVEGWRVNPTQLRVAITMPTIKGVAVGGASNVSLRGFERVPAFAAKAGGASKLSGAISADELACNASGASTIELEGAGNSLTLGASGASHVRFTNLAVETAEVVLSGASHADVKVTRTITLVASGASSLRYGGGGTLVSSQLSGNSSASQR